MNSTFDGPAFRMLSDENIGRIHEAAIQVLEKTGIKVATQEAIQLLVDAGCSNVSGSGHCHPEHRHHL